MSTFVVTTRIHGISHTRIWDPTQPLALGHPLRWIIEKTSGGVRARKISGNFNQPLQNSVVSVSDQQLSTGATIEADSLQIQIRRAIRPQPLHRSFDPEGQLHVFSSIGSSLTSFTPGNSLYEAKVGKTVAFSVQNSGNSFQLKISAPQTTIHGLPDSFDPKTPLALSAEQLSHLEITFENRRWNFAFLRQAEKSRAAANAPSDPEIANFRKALQYSISALGVFALVALVWPKAEVSPELIPPQFAKIVMAPSPSKGNKDAGGSTSTQVATKSQNTAVVQAFRAKALQNSINGLLKGGMTRLLAQADFASGTTNSPNARKVFETNTKGLFTAGPEAGLGNGKQVLVASLGGAGIGGSGTGTGIGYGKGHSAGVTGQGSSHVALDIGNSLVQEGLTRDEVGEVIHKHLSEIRYCYEAAILRTAGIEGRLIANFTIGGQGMVTASEIKTSTLPDPRLDDCILRRLATWKFPQPKGGVSVAVTYPFIFKTLGR